ncbi:olfactory receptor 5T2-like [Eublepharis macularius]|uniref:Olfactory receptor 5T2-like n=1 Tax=Eublepharis macularius TaxID=481883 RepID=A0AA97KQ19_EUBMA|nr:olfactory receptor 5T2-like [Eublepharis macularius]
MEEGNQTTVAKFILLGFTTDPKLQLILFVIFLVIYMVSLAGNVTLIALICSSSRLHTPMYFFIGNLSFLDLWYSSVYTPKILVNCISEDKSISFGGCAAQFFFSAGLAYSECYLLAAMAYDRYVAIATPLLYATAMSRKLCTGLVALSYLSGFINATVITSETFTLNFCDANIIDDFFCDLPPLVKLSCAVPESYQSVLYFILASNVITPSALILASYIFILAAILRIRSTEGRLKAFSTCASHLTAVTLYYGSILFIYSRPSSSYALERDKVVSVFYTVVIPMLNPLIYSLRNKEVKNALRKLTMKWMAKMAMGNRTIVTEFILLGISDDPEMRPIFFVVFFIIYLVNVVGNLGMILLISFDSHLHNPMYLFLWHLSFCDICYSTAIAPRMLSDLLSENRIISFTGCTSQFYFFAAFVDAECYILAVMAYDRYVAICNPLLYSTAMSKALCIRFLIGSYIAGTTNAIIHTTATFCLSFCNSNLINHFFCDVPPLLEISCSDTHINEILLFVFAGFVEMSSLSVILLSYIFILAAILRMNSAARRFKAFSTCGSHFTGVILFYGTVIFMYLRPTSEYALDQDKWASLFYTVVIPMLNPLIYSLRNKDVKEAFKKLINKKLNSVFT